MLWSWKRKVLKFLKRRLLKLENLLEAVELSSSLSREIFIDVITPQKADEVNSLIRFWNSIDEESQTAYEDREPIKIYINSLGGNLAAAFTVIDTIKISRTPVYTINVGTAYKEGFFVYLAGHKRFAYPLASFMYHRDVEQLDETTSKGTFYNYATFYESQLKEIQELILDKTKITENQYEKSCKNDWWINAKEAYKLHICDEISKGHIFKNEKNIR